MFSGHRVRPYVRRPRSVHYGQQQQRKATNATDVDLKVDYEFQHSLIMKHYFNRHISGVKPDSKIRNFDVKPDSYIHNVDVQPNSYIHNSGVKTDSYQLNSGVKTDSYKLNSGVKSDFYIHNSGVEPNSIAKDKPIKWRIFCLFILAPSRTDAYSAGRAITLTRYQHYDILYSQYENFCKTFKIPDNQHKAIVVNNSAIMYDEISKYLYELHIAENSKDVLVKIITLGHGREDGFEIRDFFTNVASFQKLDIIISRIKQMLCNFSNIYLQLFFAQCYSNLFHYTNFPNSNLHVFHVKFGDDPIVWNEFSYAAENLYSRHIHLTAVSAMADLFFSKQCRIE